MNIMEIIKNNIFSNKDIPHLQTNPGIGDMINCYVYGSQLLNNYSKIRVKVDYSVLYAFRNGNQYSKTLHDFTEQLAKRIFKDEKFELTDESLGTGCIQTQDYEQLLGVKFKPIDLSFIVEDSNFKKIDGKYLVLNVKIRQYDISETNKQIHCLINYLNSYNGKIILMGDRVVDHDRNTEYRNYKNLVYSIYDKIIGRIDKNKVIDLTENYLLHEPNIDKFIYEYNLVKNADEVLQIGYSGSYLLSMGLNRRTKVICPKHEFIKMAEQYLPKNNIFNSYCELR